MYTIYVFFTLLPAIERILQIFEVLKAYFLPCKRSVNDQKILWKWRVVPMIWALLKTNASVIALELMGFKDNLKERCKLIRQGAKQLLKKHERRCKASSKISKRVDWWSYIRSMSYTELWQKRFRNLWMDLFKEWNSMERLEQCGQVINKKFANSDHTN